MRCLSRILPMMVLALAMAGCQTAKVPVNKHFLSAPFNRLGNSQQDSSDQLNAQMPARMAVIWSHAVRHDPGKPAIQGFGARVYFYDAEQNPVPVNGDLFVYGYEDADANQDLAADRKYVFESDKLAAHYTPSELGHSYSFWVPWKESGGFRKSVALLPIFKDESGRVIRGDMSLNVLKGKAPEEQTVAKVETNPTRRIAIGRPGNQPNDSFSGAQVSHAAAHSGEKRLRTTTINVPRSMSRKLSNPEASQEGTGQINSVRYQEYVAQPEDLWGNQFRRQQAATAPAPQRGRNAENSSSTLQAFQAEEAARRQQNEAKRTAWLQQLHSNNQLGSNISVSYGPSQETDAPASNRQPTIGQTGAATEFNLESPSDDAANTPSRAARRAFGQPGSLR